MSKKPNPYRVLANQRARAGGGPHKNTVADVARGSRRKGKHPADYEDEDDTDATEEEEDE